MKQYEIILEEMLESYEFSPPYQGPISPGTFTTIGSPSMGATGPSLNAPTKKLGGSMASSIGGAVGKLTTPKASGSASSIGGLK